MTAIILLVGFVFLIMVLDVIDNTLRSIVNKLGAINDSLKLRK